MGKFLGGFVLPVLLLTGSLINRSLISLVDLIAFIIIQYNAPKIGFHSRRRLLLLWSIVIFSVLVILSQVTYLVIWAVEGSSWNVPDTWWAKLVGFMIVQSWKSPYVMYFLVVQLLALFVALVDIHERRLFLATWQDSSWGQFLSIVEQLGSHLRVASCLLLPAIQLVVGISHSSWASLPFFIGSCVGLVDWSLTSNFLGLFSWWRPLQLYAGFNILLLYTYQLPVELPSIIERVADLIGLYKISANSEWPKICSSVSLICFYMMLSFVKSDLEEMGFIMSGTESSLTEQLLPSKHSFFIRESRSGVRHTNVLLRGAVFRTFSINFFTSPCLLFHFGAFILQAYVLLGYLLMLDTSSMPSLPCFVCTD